MILYEGMKSIEHVLFHQICVLSHLMCACMCATHWSCWWNYPFKKTRFNV